MSDNSNTIPVVAVHWKLNTIQEAVEHFENEGFVGITNMKINQPALGCNDARTKAYEASKKDGSWWFFRHNYDATIGANCFLYTFDCVATPASRG